MYSLNSKTKVDKAFKMTDLFKLIKADKTIKQDAAIVESVMLEHVLNPQTIHLKNDDKCQEIYIFRIRLKEKQVPELFIKKLDETIELHTYFILEYESQVKELGIYRVIHESTIKRGKIYETPWQEEVEEDMPYCHKLKDLYDHLIMTLVPLESKEDENLEAFLCRYEEVQRLQREIVALTRKAQTEKQPRKKLDIGREVTKLKAQLQQII